MTRKPAHKELEQRVKESEKEAAKSKRAETALRESEEKFRTLFEASTDGILITDMETRRFKYANPALCRLLGYSEQEIKGLRVSDLHPKDRLWHVISEFEAHVKGQITLAESIPFLRKDGTIVYVDIGGTTVVIDGKNCSIGFLRDITNRKRAEEKAKEQLRFLQTLIDNLPTPVFYKDKDGKYTGCNRAFEEFVGRPRGKIIGKTVYDMGPKHIADKYHEKDQELFQNPGKQVYEWKVKTKTGELREVIFNKATFTDPDGKIIGLIGGISDITDRKRAEKALREREAALEAKTEELEEMNAALRVLLKQREQDKTNLEQRVLLNVNERVLPQVERLKRGRLQAEERACLEILESNLRDVISPFAHQLTSNNFRLTPTEMQIADLVRQGKRTKEIAERLNLSKRTVDSHRAKIREKLGMTHQKANLRSYLLSLE